MARKLRIRPSRGSSFSAAVVGLVIVCIGIFVVIPKAGPFGFFWTLFAVIITVGNFYNAASERGIASQIVEIEDEDMPGTRDTEARLRELDRLHERGVVTAAEHERRRAEILREI